MQRAESRTIASLPVRGITYEMEVAGEPFAHGESDKNFDVPALGSTEFDVSVTANAASALLRLASGGKQARSGRVPAWWARCRCPPG